MAAAVERGLRNKHVQVGRPEHPVRKGANMLFRLDQLIQDARFGLRQLVRSPLVATVAILTLAIGIGLNTAVFSLVNAVLLRPLPYPHAERLVWIAPYSERTGQDTSRGDYLVWKQHTQIFERMAAYGTQDLNVIVGGEASQERVASIGGDFWEITGARPKLGGLTTDEDEQGLILSYGLYERRFGGLPTVIGQAVEINLTLVGRPSPSWACFLRHFASRSRNRRRRATSSATSMHSSPCHTAKNYPARPSIRRVLPPLRG